MAKAAKRLFICLDNSGYKVSLERLKIYVALPDAKAERAGYLRIIDESGDDYVFPRQRFVPTYCYAARRPPRRLTIGSSDRWTIISVEPKRESMIGINQLRFATAQPRVAQPHR
jgi:hypothetical protein